MAAARRALPKIMQSVPRATDITGAAHTVSRTDITGATHTVPATNLLGQASHGWDHVCAAKAVEQLQVRSNARSARELPAFPRLSGYLADSCCLCCRAVDPVSAGFACSQEWLIRGGYCQQTCGVCANPQPTPVPSQPVPAPAVCSDTPPSDGTTCAQRLTWGSCRCAPHFSRLPRHCTAFS